MSRSLRLAYFCSLLLIFGVANLVNAQGSEIQVNTTSNAVADDGACSLPEAIIAANTDTASGTAAGECPAGDGPDTILLQANTTYNYSSTFNINVDSALPIIEETLTIRGDNSTIAASGSNDFRLLQANSSTSSLTLEGIIFRDADTTNIGAGVYSTAQQNTFTDVTFEDNTTTTSGGGFYTSQGVMLTNVDFIGNVANQGGGFYVANGDVIMSGDANDPALIQGNEARTGGGGFYIGAGSNAVGNFTMNYVDILNNIGDNDGNTSGQGGGGYRNSQGHTAISNVTITGNTAGNGGGGLWMDAFSGSGTVATISNATFANNTTVNNSGGGLFLENETITLTDVIFENNTVSTGSTSANDHGGGANFLAGTGGVTYTNGSVSNNSATDNGGGLYTNSSLTLTNVDITDNSASDGGGFYAGNTVSITGTQADPILIQRNVATRFGGGFYQANGDTTLEHVIIGDPTLADATDANSADSNGGGFAIGVGTSPIGDLTLTNVVIAQNTSDADDNGSGFGGGAYRVTRGDTTLTDVQVFNNSAADGGGGLWLDANTSGTVATVTDSSFTDNTTEAGSGGGLYIEGETITLTDVTFENNTVSTGSTSANDHGGGANFLAGTGGVTYTNGSVSNNSATDNGGGLYTNSSLTLTNVDITDNSASDGGGFYASSAVSITGTQADPVLIQRNVATRFGGGFYQANGDTTLEHVIIGDPTLADATDANSADSNGGGFAIGLDTNRIGDLTLTDVVIAQNTSDADDNGSGFGGGAYRVTQGDTTLTDVQVFNNVAGSGGGGLWSDGNSSDHATTVTNVSVTNNTTESGDAGGLWLENETITITNLILEDNSITDGDSNDYGGGAYFQVGTGGITYTGGNVARNSASGQGGGIYANANLTLTDVNITDNESGTNGGGLFVGNTALNIVGTDDENPLLIQRNIASLQGGGFYISNGDVSLTNVLIGDATTDNGSADGNTARNGGGGFYIGTTSGNPQGDLTLTDVVIAQNNGDSDGNDSGIGGGGYRRTAGSTTITNTQVFNNVAGSGGGGLWSDGDAAAGTATVTDSSFSDNVTSDGDAAGLYLENQTVTVTDVVIDNNISGGSSTGDDGGGAHIQAGNSDITLTRVTLTNNRVGGNGGGAYITGGSITVQESTIAGNEVGVNGGGLWVSGDLTLSNDVTDNTAGTSGGGIFHNSGNVSITGSEADPVLIQRNSAGNQGGGFFQNSGDTELTHVLLGDATTDDGPADGNAARNGGGGFYIGFDTSRQGDLTLTDVVIAQNNGDSDGNDSGIGGGGYRRTAGSTTITNTQVFSNVAGSGGGGLWSDGATGFGDNALVTDSSFSDNVTSDGDAAGLYLENQTVTVTDVVIDNNISGGSSTNDDGGGAFIQAGNSDITLTRVTLTNNRVGGNGGGAYITGGSITVQESTIAGNEVGVNGGGLWVSGDLTLSNDVTDNTAGTSGGGIFHNSGNVSITGSEADPVLIQRNSAGNQGGGFYQNSGDTELSHVLLGDATTDDGPADGNAARNGGGGFYIGFDTSRQGDLTLTDVVIAQNNGDSDGNDSGIGGGGYRRTAGSTTITNTQVFSNVAGSGGGGLWSDGATGFGDNALVTDSSFSDNVTSDGDAAGLYLENQTVTVTDVVIDNNISGGSSTNDDGGGAHIQAGNSDITLTRVTLTNNRVGGDGGGAYITGGPTTLQESTVSGNESGSNGGGLWVSGDLTLLNDVTDNTAGVNGGGIFHNSGNVSITGSEADPVLIQRNSAGNQGGGFFQNSGDTELTHVLLGDDSTDDGPADGNTAGNGGGGFYIGFDTSRQGDLTLTDVVIAQNNADSDGNDSGPGGGGYRRTAGSTTLDNTHFIANNAGNGSGGLSSSAGFGFGDVTLVTNSSFVGNTTSTSSAGGAGLQNATITLMDVLVEDNSADNVATSTTGGGLLLSANTGNINLTRLTFNNNSSGGSGGAATISGNLTVTQTTVTNNSAVNSGAGFQLNMNVPTTIDQSAFISNTLANTTGDGGGLYQASSGDLTVTNSTFALNEARIGPAIRTGGDLTLNFSSVASNQSTDASAAINTPNLTLFATLLAGNSDDNCDATSVSSNGYNISDDATCGLSGTDDQPDTDPQFAGVPADNGGGTLTVALAASSPAIDNVPAAACTVSEDQRGIMRPILTDCDAGALEAPQIDIGVTTTDDTDVTVVGGTVTYTVEATNDGPNDGNNINIVVTPDAGVTVTSGTAGTGSFDTATATWTIPTLAMGETVTLTFTVEPDASTLETTVSAGAAFDSATERDWNSANDGTSSDFFVADPPEVETQPQDITILRGTSTTLTVVADGTAPLGYQWYAGTSGDTSAPVGTDSDSFTTPNLNADAQYWVRVTNVVGQDDSATATVTVADPPEITSEPQDVTIREGTSTTLSVTSDGTPPFSYQWYAGTSGDTSTPVGTDSDSFTTPNLNADAQYRVRVSNVVGQDDSATATVTTDGIPPTLTLATTASDPTNQQTISFDATFSEPVVGFDAADLSANDASASNVTGSDVNYTFDLTFSAEGEITIELPADAVTDAVGNPNAAATLFSITYDATAPQITVDALTTTDATPALSGTIDDPAADISVTVAGQTVSATNNGDGTWTLADDTLTALQGGQYDVMASAMDTAGNIGTDADTNELVVITPFTLDFDGNDAVTSSDVVYIINRLGTTDLSADVDFDGDVDADDVQYAFDALGTTVNGS